ncbi:MAG: hypothetical protein ACYTBJ_01665 [Planctomycetota bacterium]|jgi:hypothetical protein
MVVPLRSPSIPAGATSWRQLLPKDAEKRKSFLRRLFEFLDLPKNIVQNLAQGNVEGAGRNLLDIATGLTGARLIPKLGKYLEASRPQDRPSWGLVLDILTDPLTWVSFGGAGAASKIAKAGAAGIGKIGLGKILSRGLTRAGVKRLGVETTKGLAKRIAQRPGGLLAGIAKKAPTKAMQLAQRRALKGMVPALMSGQLPKQLVKRGGIRVGIPFTYGRTVAMAGKDPLKAVAKAFIPLQVGKRIPAVRKAATAVADMLRPLRKAGPLGQRVARRYVNESAALSRTWQARVVEAFKGLAPDVRKDIGAAMHGFDPRDPGKGVDTLEKLLAKHAGDPRVGQAVQQWQGMSKQMLDEAVDIGLFTGSSIAPEAYLPLQWTDEFAEAVQKAALEGDVGKALKGGAVSVKSPFYKTRKYKTLEEFTKAGFDAELDVAKLGVKRAQHHARTVANARLMRQANTMLGPAAPAITDLHRARAGFGPLFEPVRRAESRAARTAFKTAREVGHELRPQAMRHAARIAGFVDESQRLVQEAIAAMPKGQPLKLRELTDTVLAQWIKKGAGRVKARKGLEKSLHWYNRRFFKGPVTVGLGPWPNVAFVTRNTMSGIFQALTDEDIGLAGFKHVRPVLEGLVSKVARAFKGTYHGSVVNKLLQGATKGVKVGAYSGDEILELAARHRVFERGFASTEYAMDAINRANPRLIDKLNFARQATEHTESAMRLNGFIELLKRGTDPAEAAEAVSKAFIDYRYTSAAERTVREVFPFAKFTMEQTPRTLEAVARRPVLTQPFRAIMGRPTEEGPLPKWMAGRPVLPLPTAAPAGTVDVLTQFGTPLEDLEKLGTGEGIGRTVEQSVVGSLTPPLKGVYAAVSGREPFYGREVETLTRAPAFMPEAMVEALGGKVSETRTGTYKRLPWELTVAFMNLPVTRQIRQIDKLFNDRMSVWTKTLDLITGAKIYNVDKDRELRRRIRDYLLMKAQEGDIGVINRFFATGDTDPVLTQVIKDFYKVGAGGKKR